MPASDYLDQQMWDQMVQGSGYDTNSINSAVDMFRNSYRNLTGQEPSTGDVKNFAQNALLSAEQAPGNLSYSDASNLANNYIQNTFGPDIAAHQQDLQGKQLEKTQQTIQDLIGKQTAATTAQLTDPMSPTYQKFSGMMNNMGITPTSGAFQAGLGGQIGQSASNAMNAALGGVSLPAIGGIQGMNMEPFGFAQQNSNLGHLNEMSDFGLQSALARQLAGMSQPSGLQNGIGMASSILQGGGNAAIGAGVLKNSGITWICTAMKRHGVITDSEIKKLHAHLFRALWKRPFKFLGYFVFGKLLAWLAESKGTDWRVWKPCFYQDVMAESDPVKALALYEEAFWDLFRVLRSRSRLEVCR